MIDGFLNGLGMTNIILLDSAHLLEYTRPLVQSSGLLITTSRFILTPSNNCDTTRITLYPNNL